MSVVRAFTIAKTGIFGSICFLWSFSSLKASFACDNHPTRILISFLFKERTWGWQASVVVIIASSWIDKSSLATRSIFSNKGRIHIEVHIVRVHATRCGNRTLQTWRLRLPVRFLADVVDNTPDPWTLLSTPSRRRTHIQTHTHTQM